MQATKLARAMVTKYGMSEALGKVAINYEDNGRSVSSETRNLVETEVDVAFFSPVLTNPASLQIGSHRQQFYAQHSIFTG